MLKTAGGNSPRIFLFADFGEIGGALRQAWDQLKLWRTCGAEVVVLGCEPLAPQWREPFERLACAWVNAAEMPLAEIPGLPGSIVVGICSLAFLRHADELKRLGCRRVWVNCMTWLFPQECLLYKRSGPFEAYQFDSEFQRGELERGLARYGYRPKTGHLIHSPFDADEWPFAPRPVAPDGPFVMGKLARPDLAKWSRGYWKLLGQVEHPRRRALVMGVDDTVRKWLGPMPDWAVALPAGALPAREFYRRLHCLAPLNFGTFENWPRIGLEAMACGVPIVAPAEGGWCNQIAPGETGFLARNAAEFVACLNELSRDESLRLRIAQQARQRLVTELADPERNWHGWQKLFASLGA